jgi:hypothetical protein
MTSKQQTISLPVLQHSYLLNISRIAEHHNIMVNKPAWYPWGRISLPYMGIGFLCWGFHELPYYEEIFFYTQFSTHSTRSANSLTNQIQ